MSDGEQTRTGGEWVVDVLRAEGVRHAFGIPGIHNLAIYDALLRQGELAHVLTRHEAGAAFMADGYARVSGRPGVVLVTTGGGATYALTPLVESYGSSMPIVVVMSDVPSRLVGHDVGALHQMRNQIDCFQPVTRWAQAVTEAAAIPATMHRAFETLRTSRPGPVAVSIPVDFLGAPVKAAVRDGGAGRRPGCPSHEIEAAARLLAAASKPLLLVGGGVVAAGAEAELRALARRLDAPVITTVMGRGVISERDALWQGVLPNRHATEAVLKAADVILAVGCRFAHRSTRGLLLNLEFTSSQTLIHLDLDPAVIGAVIKPQLPIVGDAKDGLTRLVEALGPASPRATWDHRWREGLRSAMSPKCSRETTEMVTTLMRTLRDALPDDAIIVNDQAVLNYWMEWHFPVVAPRTFLYPIGSAILGYGVPAAIGAKIARPQSPVICVVGDGGFLYSVNELATAVKYRLPVVFLVVNDDSYGAVKWLQEKMFKGRWGETELTNPDFPALARAYGALGERVTSVAALGPAIRTALAAELPTVLELKMTIDPPWEL